MRWTVLDSPIGEFSVATDDDAVCGAHFGRVESAVDVPGDELSGRVVAELRAYFAGELTDFTVPVAARLVLTAVDASEHGPLVVPLLTRGQIQRCGHDRLTSTERRNGVSCP